MRKQKANKVGKAIIKLFFPERAEDTVSEGLRMLTHAIADSGVDIGGYGLGGEYGYGVNYENDTFMMHRFCWCMDDDCKWCSGGEPNFWHKPSGFMAWWYKWIGRGMQHKKISRAKWIEIIVECINSIESEVIK